MKKNNLLLLPFTFILLCLFSCGGRNTPPTFNFKTGTGYTHTDVTNNNTTNNKVGIEASKAGSKLHSLEISHVDIYGVSHSDTIITITDRKLQKEFTYTYYIYPPTPYATGVATWSFKVLDEGGNSVRRSFTITYI